MSTQVPPEPVTNRAQHEAPRESAWVGGLTMFAGVMMLIVGIFQALEGIAALLNDEVYVTTPNYIYAFDLSGWGWIHLLLGVLVAVVGVAIMQGQTWGRCKSGIDWFELARRVDFGEGRHRRRRRRPRSPRLRRRRRRSRSTMAHRHGAGGLAARRTRRDRSCGEVEGDAHPLPAVAGRACSTRCSTTEPESMGRRGVRACT